MACTDRVPLVDGPVAARIRQRACNRLGAVYSALYSFWTARHATIAAGSQSSNRRGSDSVYSALYSALWYAAPAVVTAGQQPGGGRRDAYSVILFNGSAKTVLTNDFTSTPDQLLGTLLSEQAGGATNFTTALDTARLVMLQCWSAERLVSMIRFSSVPSLINHFDADCP